LHRVFVVGRAQGDGLGRVDGRAAAKTHNGVAALAFEQRHALLDQRHRGVRQHLVKHHISRATGLEGLQHRRHQPQLGDHRVSHHQHPRVIKVTDGLAQARTGPRAD